MKAIAFGEILWDVFTDTGKKTLGGAPLNVAGHIKRLGGESYIISGVGNDELGNETIKYIHEMGMTDKYIIRTSDYETGRALVTLRDGIPSYTFNRPAAWDRIELTKDMSDGLFSEEYDVLIFGTLAQREQKSRETLRTILKAAKARELFFDVNLRLDFYTPEIIIDSLRYATILKMNDEEQPVILKIAGCESIKELMNRYSLSTVIVTYGKKGTYCYSSGKCFHCEPENVPVVDTVGAGDSLSAGFLYFTFSGYPVDIALAKASMLADYVVQKRGAIPEYDETFRRKLLS